MNITGLENNYYFSGNDIWVKFSDFIAEPLRLEVKVTNNSTGLFIPALKLYSPDDVYECNISLPVRALQPDPDHLDMNTMCSYTFEIKAFFKDTSILPTISIVENKQFIRGGRNKLNSREWHAASGDKLLIGKWLTWAGVELPFNFKPVKIVGIYLMPFNPSASESYLMPVRGMCSPTTVKFLNSEGGYQFYIFEHTERTIKTKGKGSVSRTGYSLRADRSRSIGRTEEEIITLKTRTPKAVQDVFIDLIKSNDILLYDPSGVDDLSRWHRVELDQSNEATLNTVDGMYENEVDFKVPNYVNRDL